MPSIALSRIRTFHCDPGILKSRNRIKLLIMKRMVRRDPGRTAEELFDAYTMMGEDPFIVQTGPNGITFSAWDYAEQRCKEICAARKGDSKTV